MKFKTYIQKDITSGKNIYRNVFTVLAVWLLLFIFIT